MARTRKELLKDFEEIGVHNPSCRYDGLFSNYSVIADEKIGITYGQISHYRTYIKHRRKYLTQLRRKEQAKKNELWQQIKVRTLEMDLEAQRPEATKEQIQYAQDAVRMAEEGLEIQRVKTHYVNQLTSAEKAEIKKQWIKKNPDKAREIQVRNNKTWRKKHPEHWSKKNAEYCKTYRRRKRRIREIKAYQKEKIRI